MKRARIVKRNNEMREASCSAAHRWTWRVTQLIAEEAEAPETPTHAPSQSGPQLTLLWPRTQHRFEEYIYVALFQGREYPCVVIDEKDCPVRRPRRGGVSIAWIREPPRKTHSFQGNAEWVSQLRTTRTRHRPKESYRAYWLGKHGQNWLLYARARLDQGRLVGKVGRGKCATIQTFVVMAVGALRLDGPASEAWLAQIERLGVATTVLQVLEALRALAKLAKTALLDVGIRKDFESVPWLAELGEPVLTPMCLDERWWTKSQRSVAFSDRDFSQRLVLIGEQPLGVGHADAPRTIRLTELALGLKAVVTQLSNGAACSRPRVVYANSLSWRPETLTCNCGGSPYRSSTTAGCSPDCKFGICSVLDEARPDFDGRAKTRCFVENPGAFLDANFASSLDAAVARVNQQIQAGSFDATTLSVVTANNLVPVSAVEYAVPSNDQVAALLGLRLDAAAQAPTAWMRDSAPPGTERRLLGRVFSPLFLQTAAADWTDRRSPAGLENGPPRPLWSLCCGIGNELGVLADANAPLSEIHAVDADPWALRTYVRVASDLFPTTPLTPYGDFLGRDVAPAWTAPAIHQRLDRAGLPIIVAGWPCAGHAGANRNAHGTHAFDHASSAMLLEVTRILREVHAWMDNH